MIAFLLNHIWQSTVFSGVVALLVFALKHNRAALRYRLWMIASAKFLIPFAALVAFGSHIGRKTGSPPVQPGLSQLMDRISAPLTAPATALPAIHQAAHRQHTIPAAYVLFAIWLVGFAAVLFAWCVQWRRIRVAARAGVPADVGKGIRALAIPTPIEPGVFGIFRPVLLLPEGIPQCLGAKHLELIVAHELCHIRRRDNLSAAIHMLIEAVFWFHPLVWWIGSRLEEERERACDEEVLALGGAPEVYAKSIVKACRFYLEAPLACMSGVTGADLKRRIANIMTQRIAAKLDRRRKLLLGVVGTLAVVGPIGFGLISPPQGRAQDHHHKQAEAPVGFEVASIRKSDPKSHGDTQVIQPGGRFEGTNKTVARLIMFAYDVSPRQLIGGPDWMRSDKYDVIVKPETAVPVGSLAPSTVELPDGADHSWTPLNRGGAATEEIRRMMQSVLAERFHLKAHRETRELPVYALVLAKNGPKLRETTKDQKPLMSVGGLGQISFRGQGAGMIAMALATLTGRFVEDHTGLTGKYDFDLRWTPDANERAMMLGAAMEHGMDPNSFSAGAHPGDSGPSLFTAIEEQLGLRLEPNKGPVDVLVIDHVEKPTEN
jgi:bla regulator protein BlaR1